MAQALGTSSRVHRFGVFEFDPATGELRKQGMRIKLQGQPIEVLALLLERPGQIVTREELQKKLWRSDTFVDFEHSLNAAVKRLRDALDDSAETPRYIETLSRRGYRFIPPVEGHRSASKKLLSPRRLGWVAIATLALLVVLGAFNVRYWREQILAGGRRPIRSLAVLPFENLSGDPGQEYFTDGMTEGLITNLGKITALRVISRTSTARYKGTKKSVPEIAGELRVDAVVEGSVLRSGNRVRITAQLIQANAERHLWAESYERDLNDILSLQAEVTEAIANQVAVKLTPKEQAHLASTRPVNPEAYELCLKGRYEWKKGTPEGVNKGLQYFRQAIKLDPSYAMAYSGVADSYSIMADSGFVFGSEVLPEAKAAAAKALELDGTLAEAHASLALPLIMYERNWTAALKELETAIQLNPNYARAHQWYADALCYVGRNEEAVREIEIAQRLDPLSQGTNADFAQVLYLGRRYERAIVEAQQALELESSNTRAQVVLGEAYLAKEMPNEALAEFQKLPSGVCKDVCIARAYAALGKRQEALKMLGVLQQLISPDSMVGPHACANEFGWPRAMATAYLAAGNTKEALSWLQKGARDGQSVTIRVDPALDHLRSDSDFQDLLRRMNFPQ